MICDIFNPYSNNEVTSHYIDIIRRSLESIFVECTFVNTLKREKTNKNKIVLVISPLDVSKAKKMGYKYILCWEQGIIPEESYMRHNSKIRKVALSFLEKKGLKLCDFVFFVSDEMRLFLERKYRLSLQNSYVMPCFNENFPTSNVFTEKTQNLFVYAGGIEPWQCLRETLLLYSEIEKKYPHSKLLILVRDTTYAAKMAESIGVKNYDFGYYPKDKLNAILSKVEYGFWLRNNSVVNQVSTPTKLSTYICNGIIPIYSSSIRSFLKVASASKYTIAVDGCSGDHLDYSVFDCHRSVNDLYTDYRNAFGDYYCDEHYITKIAQTLLAVLKIE